MTAAATKLFIPPYPPRRDKPRGSLSTVYVLQRNPIEFWTKAHFERPVLIGRTILGVRAAAHDPAAVRRVFLDNAANYRKDDLQLRVLSPGLGNGLLTAEGEDWRVQRRALAPLFSPRQVADFAPAVHSVAEAAVARMRRRRDGAVTEVTDLMSRLTLAVLEETLFSQGIGGDPSAFRQALTRYFETIGRLDPLDLIGAPAFLPRIRRWRGREALEFFDAAVDDIIERRQALLARGEDAPRDLLTLLLSAKDPESGRGITVGDVRANIVTFIGAGHETTANALTWTLYLLSQSPEWRERAEAEADTALIPGRLRPIAARPCGRCSRRRCVFIPPPPSSAARRSPPTNSRVSRSPPARWSPCRLSFCTGGEACGRTRTRSIPRAFLAPGASASTASPISRSAPGRASASAWRSPCRKG